MLKMVMVAAILLVTMVSGQLKSSWLPNLIIPVSTNCTEGSESEVTTPPPTELTAMDEEGGSAESASSLNGGGSVLYVGPCVELAEAMNLITSDVRLELEPGVHHMRPSTDKPRPPPLPHHSLQRVALAGQTGQTSVVVECEDEMGLAFMNVSGLRISDVTLINCGIDRDVLTNSLQLLGETVRLWYVLPQGSKVGVLLGNCRDVKLRNVGVVGTKGVGLLGVNILGESTLQNVTFSRNMRRSCNKTTQPRHEDAHREIGGGAVLIYQDNHTHFANEMGVATQPREEQQHHTLTVTESTFDRNAGCTSVTFANHRLTSTTSTLNLHYLVGGGGGLSILLTQQSYSVSVRVESSTFLRNDAKEGAGAYVSTFSGIRNSSVSFVDCVFEENGLPSTKEEGEGEGPVIAESVCQSGAGLMIRTDMKRPEESEMSFLSLTQTTTLIQIIATRFSNNAAMTKGGGVSADSAYISMTAPTDTTPPTEEGIDSSQDNFSYSTQWIVENTTFVENTANQGSAAHFRQGHLPLSTPSSHEEARGRRVPLTLRNVTSRRNTKRTPPGGKGSHLSSSALDITNLAVTIQHSLLCEDNAVTALVLHDSTINIAEGSRARFLRNTGYRGGALLLEGEAAVIRLHDHAAVVFENNSAVLGGGAIYIIPPTITTTTTNYSHTPSYASCFLYPPTTRQNCSTCFNTSRTLSSIRFTNNHAPTGGAVFGSTLESCPWTWLIHLKTTENVYQAMYNDAESFIEFDVFPNTTDVLSTLPANMEIHQDDRKIELHPGQSATLRVSIKDSFGQRIPSVIQSTTFDVPRSVVSATIGSEGSWYVNYRNHPFLRVRGRENQSVNVTIIEILSLISVNVTVKLLPCSLGFVYNMSQRWCSCDPQLRRQGVKCNFTNYQELQVPPNTWVGLLESEPTPPVNRTPTQAHGDLVVHECPLSYCLDTPSQTTPPNNNSLCLENSLHGGLLCGGCVPNHSAVLGPYNQCKICTNSSLMLILLFGLAGIVLFLCIALLQLTVDKGWVYVIIFYCNTVTLYAYLLPSLSKLHRLLIPANLISLQIGFGVCFYDGMTTLDHIGLQLVFPLYLFLLMVVFALLSKRSSRLSQHFSPTQTFVTLGVMSYTSVLETCVTAINALRLTTLDGRTSSLRWTADPNLAYFTGKHRYLLIISGLLVVTYIIPFPVLMLLPGVLYKHTKKFKPFFDAMWAPYQIRLRFWLGVRVLCLVAVYCMVYFVDSAGIRVLLFSTTLFLFLQLQVSLRPFRSQWINLFDQTLMAIIVLLAVLTPYSETRYAPDHVLRGPLFPAWVWESIVLVGLGLSYLLMMVGLCCNLVVRFPQVRGIHAATKSAILGCCRRVREEVGRRREMMRRRREGTLDNISLSGLHHNMGLRMTATSFRLPEERRRSRRSFNQLRETLLDSAVEL